MAPTGTAVDNLQQGVVWGLAGGSGPLWPDYQVEMLRLMKTLVDMEYSCEAADDLVAAGEKATKYRKDKDGNRITPADVAALAEEMKEAVGTMLMLIRTAKAQMPRVETPRAT